MSYYPREQDVRGIQRRYEEELATSDYGGRQEARQRYEDMMLLLGYPTETWLIDVAIEEVLREAVVDEVEYAATEGLSGEAKAEYLFRRMQEQG